MVITFVVRLVAERLREGGFAGEVHVVPSGVRRTVHTVDELLEALGNAVATDGKETDD